jgi:sugar (pentulose or hexulose) kinase
VAAKAYLAFDLGAESGRALLARLRDGLLEVDEVHRFANTPIREDGSLRWDARALAGNEARAGAPQTTVSD